MPLRERWHPALEKYMQNLRGTATPGNVSQLFLSISAKVGTLNLLETGYFDNYHF